MKVTHILILSDLSPESVPPCKPVTELARALGARVTLLHVREHPFISPFSILGESVEMQESLAQQTEAARAQLEGDRSLFPRLEVKTDVIGDGNLLDDILQYVSENDVDLIAMSTHGREGLRHALLGSVAEALLRRSPVPIVVFPRPQARTGEKMSA
jgi:nucleotide-binding universal stress UspA family protein